MSLIHWPRALAATCAGHIALYFLRRGSPRADAWAHRADRLWKGIPLIQHRQAPKAVSMPKPPVPNGGDSSTVSAKVNALYESAKRLERLSKGQVDDRRVEDVFAAWNRENELRRDFEEALRVIAASGHYGAAWLVAFAKKALEETRSAGAVDPSAGNSGKPSTRV